MVAAQRERPFIVRAIYFLAIGLWFSAIWIGLAWFFMATILLLPLGLWMVNRVPQVLTLKRAPHEEELQVYQNTVVVRMHEIRQLPWLVRILYLIVIGWWLGLFWATLGWLLCATIILLPLGIPMLNLLPTVTTLTRTRA